MIDSFSGEYSYLSNFYTCLVVFDGHEYRSSEHAFQAAKSVDEAERGLVRSATHPADAKRVGHQITCRPDWESIKIAIMKEVVNDKFRRNSALANKLIDTDGQELIEGNNHGDIFWGQCKGLGSNHLGKVLMEVRREIIEDILDFKVWTRGSNDSNRSSFTS